MSDSFVPAVAACLLYEGGPAQDALEHLVQRVFESPANPSRDDLAQLQQDIQTLLPNDHDRIALVYGGATKIKGYVFEAPKLPEIRGASALLDWVNEVELPRLWGIDVANLSEEIIPQKLIEAGIIYASGGNILAFAPAAQGQERAQQIEQVYTEHTLTANSVAVAETFRLIELRYGRLAFDDQGQLGYWADQFVRDWKNPQYQQSLKHYYYYPLNTVKPDDGADEAIKRRFLNRKTFGELVTVLATKANRRRDELASHGMRRSVPLYELLPWAERCDSSGIRPAIMHTTVGDEITPRELSEASARKRYIGQLLKVSESKRDAATKWFIDRFGDEWAKRVKDLDQRAWEQRWLAYLQKDGKATPYAQAMAEPSATTSKLADVYPAQDVGEIAQASTPSRYIGIIYADGNNVGRLIATLETPAAYAEVSTSLRTIATDAVFQALARHLKPRWIRTDQGDHRWVHPFEILAIGGDDLFLIVPGDCAFDITAAIGDYFEREICKALPNYQLPNAVLSAVVRGRYAADTCQISKPYAPSLGLSAGVIVAQENAPIFFLRDLVEELLKLAKDKAKQHANQGFFSGAIDFMVMKSITMVTDKINVFRRQALGDNGETSPRRLTARSYSWHEFAGLLQTIRALKQAGMPRSQLYRIRRALDAESGTHIVTSVMEYLYTRSRLRGNISAVLAKHIEHNWCYAPLVSNGRGGLPPWMPIGQQGWETIWPDLLEAYEMVPQQGEACQI